MRGRRPKCLFTVMLFCLAGAAAAGGWQDATEDRFGEVQPRQTPLRAAAHGVCLLLYGRQAGTPAPARQQGARTLELAWKDNFLTIRGPRIPGGALRVQYLEAYCRPGSTDRDWGQTVIKHRTELVQAAEDGGRLELECRLADGVRVRHQITAGSDEVDFRLVATNPTQEVSQAHWAQPCIRVDTFTGRGREDYIPQCFVFLEGRLTRLPTEPWATKARYVPGQVYRAPGVGADDVNPRPVSKLVCSNGLCGCFSADDTMIMATAWEPYQELFQGVATCVHSDFRIGGLAPGETKEIRGKIYLVPADVAALVERYERNFPEHVRGK
ncbi:MAG: hypothetical protein WD278_01090 [Pirellulales bacterium]